jgi:hypothetical protein
VDLADETFFKAYTRARSGTKKGLFIVARLAESPPPPPCCDTSAEEEEGFFNISTRARVGIKKVLLRSCPQAPLWLPINLGLRLFEGRQLKPLRQRYSIEI